MATTISTIRPGSARVEPLPEYQSEEALSFLGERPLHTVIMAGLLREHGPTVPSPQGTFYGCREHRGRLEGVALIGRATMFEARTEAALASFAGLARQDSSVRMIMGEESELKRFLSHYVDDNKSPRLACSELFYQFVRGAGEDAEGIAGLRQATSDHLDKIVKAHAEMCEEESGQNPLETDPEGFRLRCAARVKQGRVWALIENGELIFKADIITETPEAAYLEGVWVSPGRRQEGYGRRCWAQLSRTLLSRVPSLCGFANVRNSAALSFYERVGGALLGRYDKVYL
jgi:ribosomal protein S18 acetylase RimI-like enzyme